MGACGMYGKKMPVPGQAGHRHSADCSDVKHRSSRDLITEPRTVASGRTGRSSVRRRGRCSPCA